MSSTRTLVVGAGLAGLSAAYHLSPADTLVVERNPEVGGLCRSTRIDGFTFDHPGHVLHLRDAGVRRLLDDLLPNAFAETERKAFVYSRGVHTSYPYQVNTHGLPPAVVRECVVGFASTLCRRSGDARDFKTWIIRTFGDGIARHFMLPFNEKLYRVSLDELASDWAAGSIPRPTLHQVIRGALGWEVRGLGYNARFSYPTRGGIDVIARALAARCGEIRLNRSVQRIDPVERRAELNNGEMVQYEHLISTLPLDDLLRLLEPLPHPLLREASSRLRAVRVISLNFGIDRARVLRGHWVYFPEPEFPFYRIGSPSNYSEAMSPRGCSSLSVEVAASRDDTIDLVQLREEVREGLLRARVIRPSDRIVAEDIRVLDPAYVLHDHYRRQVLAGILEILAQHGVDSTGRYGGWGYGSMESALQQGAISARQTAGTRNGTALATS